MKKLFFILSVLLLTVSCSKKSKITPVDEAKQEVFKKLRFEINMIKGNYKKISMNFVFIDMRMKNGSLDEPIFIKPAHLKFELDERVKSKGVYGYFEKEEPAEKNYIIESKNPISYFEFTCLVYYLDTQDKGNENVKFKIEVFADNKLIKTFENETIPPPKGDINFFQLKVDMKDY